MSRGNLKQVLYPVCQFCHHRLNEYGGCDNCNSYGLEDYVKGRVDDKTLDRIAYKADELQKKNLGEEK